jgi:hypothetical protein
MGGLGGRLVGGVLADHREDGIGVQVVQSRYGLEGGSPSGPLLSSHVREYERHRPVAYH